MDPDVQLTANADRKRRCTAATLDLAAAFQLKIPFARGLDNHAFTSNEYTPH